MTETHRSAAGGPAGAGMPAQAVRDLVLTGAAVATVAWALGALFARVPWAGLGGPIGVLGFGLWRTWRNRERWPEQRAVERALRQHVDPGPEYRAATDHAARERLVPRSGGLFAGIVLVGALVLACAVTAVLRDDAWAVLPAIVLVGLFGWISLLQRRRAADADRWLADPPYPRAEEEAR